MPAKKPTIWLLDEYKLSRDSWWFRLGIPKTIDFSRYFFLRFKKDDTEAERKEYNNMSNEILRVIHTHDRREVLPQDILPQAMYADFKEMYAGNRCCLLSFKWEFSHFMFGRRAISSRDIPAQYAC